MLGSLTAQQVADMTTVIDSVLHVEAFFTAKNLTCHSSKSTGVTNNINDASSQP